MDQDGLRPYPDRVTALLNYPTPTNLRQLRGFLGIVNWYERFIKHCADLKVPLLKLLRKKQRWLWEDEQREAFEELKNALTTAPVLARPDFSKSFYVQCDTSGSALGAVLVQEYEVGEHPILYISRALNAAERNYTTTEREYLALVWSLKKLRPYLEGYVFTAVTDHSALKWLRTINR